MLIPILITIALTMLVSFTIAFAIHKWKIIKINRSWEEQFDDTLIEHDRMNDHRLKKIKSLEESNMNLIKEHKKSSDDLIHQLKNKLEQVNKLNDQIKILKEKVKTPSGHRCRKCHIYLKKNATVCPKCGTPRN